MSSLCFRCQCAPLPGSSGCCCGPPVCVRTGGDMCVGGGGGCVHVCVCMSACMCGRVHMHVCVGVHVCRDNGAQADVEYCIAGCLCLHSVHWSTIHCPVCHLMALHHNMPATSPGGIINVIGIRAEGYLCLKPTAGEAKDHGCGIQPLIQPGARMTGIGGRKLFKFNQPGGRAGIHTIALAHSVGFPGMEWVEVRLSGIPEIHQGSSKSCEMWQNWASYARTPAGTAL
jgi:hypothetical protein|mmetsp:Transcript_22583/g.38561  ORF Transcript_22583/g.38561 Transcript_22583/m.38561 type:complete len:228 (-) Transcript_22583:1526-2209(-)